ncbi:pygopus homolog 2-like, partial [Chiloscyllium plagiosum]|uniref:pygopus homolog 2-like n=1 Tax=Chiloscyllium plagiosum TaxID=36176 RepID=UPI001CB8113F
PQQQLPGAGFGLAQPGPQAFSGGFGGQAFNPGVGPTFSPPPPQAAAGFTPAGPGPPPPGAPGPRGFIHFPGASRPGFAKAPGQAASSSPFADRSFPPPPPQQQPPPEDGPKGFSRAYDQGGERGPASSTSTSAATTTSSPPAPPATVNGAQPSAFERSAPPGPGSEPGGARCFKASGSRGPASSSEPVYPCGFCLGEVHDDQDAILCEASCQKWFHRECTGMTETAYGLLTRETSAVWACDFCLKTKEIQSVYLRENLGQVTAAAATAAEG